MTRPRLLRYCDEQPDRRTGRSAMASGVVHGARPGAYLTLCGAGLETLHLLGPIADGGEPCSQCWEQSASKA